MSFNVFSGSKYQKQKGYTHHVLAVQPAGHHSGDEELQARVRVMEVKERVAKGMVWPHNGILSTGMLLFPAQAPGKTCEHICTNQWNPPGSRWCWGQRWPWTGGQACEANSYVLTWTLKHPTLGKQVTKMDLTSKCSAQALRELQSLENLTTIPVRKLHAHSALQPYAQQVYMKSTQQDYQLSSYATPQTFLPHQRRKWQPTGTQGLAQKGTPFIRRWSSEAATILSSSFEIRRPATYFTARTRPKVPTVLCPNPTAQCPEHCLRQPYSLGVLQLEVLVLKLGTCKTKESEVVGKHPNSCLAPGPSGFTGTSSGAKKETDTKQLFFQDMTGKAEETNNIERAQTSRGFE
eukprot:1157161-Pelagomonas_calceolata.AAC.21